MNLFDISETYTKHPSNKEFQLHTHDNYEIILFLKGDTNYIVEEKSYTLNPGDMILVRKHQLHRAYHNTPSEYIRIVINILPQFFKQYRCPEYERQFIDESLNFDNRINSAIVKKNGIYDAIMRLKKYSDNFTSTDTPICISVLIEILYLINRLDAFTKSDITNSQLAHIINYINNNFAEDISLNYISKKFYISKYHLCHIFKNHTGLTFNQYLNQKRFAYLKDLVLSGTTITDASMRAGFKSYSSFYRAYLNEYGISPSEGLHLN